jgi:hypothetical protein
VFNHVRCKIPGNKQVGLQVNLLSYFKRLILCKKVKKGKDIPVTGHGGP